MIIDSGRKTSTIQPSQVGKSFSLLCVHRRSKILEGTMLSSGHNDGLTDSVQSCSSSSSILAEIIGDYVPRVIAQTIVDWKRLHNNGQTRGSASQLAWRLETAEAMRTSPLNK
jgi:hypothetical protein